VEVGFLEFRDNGFIRGVAERLADLSCGYLQVGALRHPSPFPCRLLVDRVSFCDPFLRSLACYWSRAGVYVLNNPFFTAVYDKLSELLVYDRLSIEHPRTTLLPRRNPVEDMAGITAGPDWEAVASEIGFPCILKPVDGYAWQDVLRADDLASLKGFYDKLGATRTLIAQQHISYVRYYRAFCVDRNEVMVTRWTPRPLDHGEYAALGPDEPKAAIALIEEKTAALNQALGLDFNTVEWCLTASGVPIIIDSYNDVPDVRKEKLPAACYDWIVDRFCACIRSRLQSGEHNAMPDFPALP
jgi:hypothetical protein